MALDLDTRQRAMLQEMGITVWWPEPPAAEYTTPAPAMPAEHTPAPRQAPPVAESPGPAMPPTAGAPATPRPTSAARAVPAAADPAPAPAAGGEWTLCARAPVRLYADEAAQGPCWLVVVECPDPGNPLAGDVGRLLDNMLRALQRPGLPRAHCLPLERCAAGTAQPPDSDRAALDAAVQALAPDLVLLLGHVPARWALGLAEPLGHLRTRLHQVAGCTAVVSYDPAFLLRSPATKAAAWADLCGALSHLAGRAAASPLG